MKIIVCVDDNNGMMFNNQRQSRDDAVIEDVVKTVGGRLLFLTSYSTPLFRGKDIDMLFESDLILEGAEREDYCFIEDLELLPYKVYIDELIIYRWNKTYPADRYLDVDPTALSMQLVSKTEFAGESHEKITKELYKKFKKGKTVTE